MAGKRVLIYTNHFYPEDFKVNDIAFAMAAENYEVTVITGLPNYPKGKIYNGYGFFKKSRENVNGVDVIRLPLIPRGNARPFRLMMNYATYALSVILYSFYRGFGKKFDIVFVHHTSPIFIGLGAIIIRKMHGAKLFFWNLDLWPESIQAVSKIKNKFVIKLLEWLVRRIYKACDVMLIGSKGFEGPVLEKGVPREKIMYFPNWAEDVFTVPSSEDIENMPPIRDSFKIMFAGNIGEAQDFENILETISMLRHENITWLIVGDGRKKNWLEEQIKANNLSENVILLGRHPLEKMPATFQHADVMLVSLKDQPIFRLTVPAKIQAYMASGKPILAMLNGEGSALVNEARCGLACDAENNAALAEKAMQLKNLSAEALLELGRNGQAYYNNFFHKNKNLKKLFRLISDPQP